MLKKAFSKRIILILSLIIFPGICLQLPGLDPAKKIVHYDMDVYLTEDGLPQSSVLTLLQTKDGYLWLGTYEGVARFDGIDFKILNKYNTPEMAGNRVRCLHEDLQGNLWIGTSGGLLFYGKGVYRNFTEKDGLCSDFVAALYEDSTGKLWIGTTKGLSCFNRGTFTSFTRSQGLNNEYVMTLTGDETDGIRIGTADGGIYLLRNGKIKRLKIPGLPAKTSIRVLYKDKDGSIWIGTRGYGLIREKNGKFDFYSQKNGLSGSDIRALFQDSRGCLWIGTNGKGLNRMKNGVISFSTSKQGLLNHPIRSIIEDREGNLWVGTRAGLAQLKDGKFIIYNNRGGLPAESVRSVFRDRRQNIWIGTVSGGLTRFRNGTFKTFDAKDGLKSNHIWTIAQSRSGGIWIGTYGGGLHLLEKDKIRHVYTTKNGLANNVVRAVFVDSRDRTWVGSNGGGVDVISAGKIVNYNSRNGLSDDFVYAIAEDRQGDIWIGTYAGSIDRHREGAFKTYGLNEGLTGYAIWSIYPDEDGTVWIGTDGGGLLRFKNDTFTRITVKDGLYSDLAFTIIEDEKHNLWMNCNQGIYSIRKQDVEDFLSGKKRKIPCVSFGKLQGIKNTECNGPAQPAGCLGDNGKLWFPTIRGAVVIDPENMKVNHVLPLVVIEEVTADEQPVYSYPRTPRGELKLAPGKKRIEFKYAGLSFTDPARVRFKYKLEGYDQKWLNGGDRRRASYTNIPAGDYTFRVIACNNDGKWNNEGTSLSFTLVPFFWETWWFRGLLLILFAFLSYIFINFIKSHMRLIAFWKKKSHIGSYEIEEQIGIGGMGVIYKVHSLLDKDRTFAMKVLKDEYLTDAVRKKRFKNESLLVDRLDHPHIVKVYERGEYNDNIYIVMELLEGDNLAQRLEQKKYPTVIQCVHMMRQVADILVNLGRENIIHRDLKPENIMLIDKKGDGNYVKLLDFGIARAQTFTNLTETGQVVGTLPYMPPEVISDGMHSHAADIYSLGVIAYEMLTGSKPFTGDNPVEILNRIIDNTPQHPVDIDPRIPHMLNQLILRMIAKDPEDRPDAPGVLSVLNDIHKNMAGKDTQPLKRAQ